MNLLHSCYSFKCKPHKMVRHTQTIRRQQPTNCLSMFDHFVGFAVKGLKQYFCYGFMKGQGLQR